MLKTKITLVIPAWNEEKYIRPTLESVNIAKSLYEKIIKERVEIIVVDNDSTDNTAKIAIDYGCRVVKFEKHNLAAVRNAGARYALGEYIAFVDGDSSIIPRDAFIQIHRNLERKNIFGGGSRMRPDRINSFFGFGGFGLIDFLLYLIKVDLSGYGLILIYLRRSDFEKMNGFDEKFWALEDIDFARRMKKMAKKKNQKLKHLNKRVIVCTRKNKLIPLSKMIPTYFKIIKKDGVKKKENVYDLMYDVNKLR